MTFQSPGIRPALLGKAHGNNPALSPTLHSRKSHRGKGPNHNVKPPAINWHCGNNQKVYSNYSPAIPLGGEGSGSTRPVPNSAPESTRPWVNSAGSTRPAVSYSKSGFQFIQRHSMVLCVVCIYLRKFVENTLLSSQLSSIVGNILC